jgi:Caspase domain
MTALPDAGRSRAVLIGASSYRHLENLPAVANNLIGFRDVLIDPALGGWRADRCAIVAESSSREVSRALREHAEAAEDTLLVYFAGHGRTGARNELYLCLPDTDLDELWPTALPYEQLREVFADSRALKKVVILDCCFSGRALADQAGEGESVIGQVGIEGTYILTATAANAVALAPPGARYTAFTGTLLDLLQAGIPGGPELITFAALFPHLKFALTSRGLPRPHQQGSDTISHLALTRNSAHHPQPSPRSMAADLPQAAPTAAAQLQGTEHPRTPPPRHDKAGVMPTQIVPEAVRNDPARIIRILTDAERLAQSIADEFLKGPAIAGIARAMAATDPARAARLGAHAERLAQSIARKKLRQTGTPAIYYFLNPFRDQKNDALASIARALAATDPDRAERIAQSIGPKFFKTEADRFSKSAALADIARALAAADPARADRLNAEAIHIAQSITDQSSKSKALAHIAWALAATHPDRAKRIALGTYDKYCADVARALAGTDPDRAERVAQSITSESSKSAALAGVAGALAAADPDRAERIAQSITDQSSKSAALAGVAGALAATDPDRAERIAQSITSESSKSAALADVAGALAATDPDRADRLGADAERIAQSITREPTKSWALVHIARALAATDPDRAEQIAQSITDQSSKSAALAGVAKALAASDPDRAERITQSITDEAHKFRTLDDIARALAGADPDRAERIAQSITDQSSKSWALVHIAGALAATDPDRAEQIAQSITDQSSKSAALADVVEALAATDPDRAERIAQSIPSQFFKDRALAHFTKALIATTRTA